MHRHVVAETTVVVTEPVIGSAVERLRRLIAEAAARSPRRLIIDLRRADGMDPAALIFLLQVHRQMECADGRLLLRAPADPVRRLLRVTRADQVLEIDEAAPAVAVTRAW